MKYLVWMILCVVSTHTLAQVMQVPAQPNVYTAIESILASDNNNVDSVVVSDVTGFDAGDTVMVYCVQGSGILTSDADEDNLGIISPSNYSGKYAFLIVNEIIGGSRTVVMNASFSASGIAEIGPLKEGEVAQLIRVPSYREAMVNSTVSAPAWDGHTGGVVAMFVTRKLELNADIDVSGKGFRGAVETELSDGACSSTDPQAYDSAFYHTYSTPIRAGLKGEGITDTTFSFMRGWSKNINGGGGGNGRLSGGGGGSNYSSGGKGGCESGQCTGGVDSPGGVGGFSLHATGKSYYLNFDDPGNILILNRWNRIFMGGGGGTGTRISGKTSTNGGNGGGLVVIVADTIQGNGHYIRADGESVSAVATGAGGGGGGGGGIILDVSGYKEDLNLSAVGGDGGNTNDSQVSGPGGGGGGGIYWLAGSEEEGVQAVLTTKGDAGRYLGSNLAHCAAEGGFPDRKDGLEAPLKGFLFNSVPTEFWACSDQVPESLVASEPKGGDGTYAYQWVDSSSTQNQWLPVSGATDKDLVFSQPLSDTTYFRRVVSSGLLDADTSFRIAVYVHQAITGNMVSADDEICQGMIPQPFVGVGSPAQGDGSYTFRWLVHEGDGNYLDAPGDNRNPAYASPALQNTSHFARMVRSGACRDTTDALLVNVWTPLTGNDITPFDTICLNSSPDLLTGPVPGGGKDGDKRYSWESAADTAGTWTPVGADTREYQSGPLSQTIWFRRVAYSGLGQAGDACVDTSAAVEILNVDPVTGNDISADQIVCTSDIPDLLLGNTPDGGMDGYRYQWVSRTVSGDWEDADNSNGNAGQNYQPPVMTGDDMEYRRVVGSGGAAQDVCTDTSELVNIEVLPPIIYNDIISSLDVKCQGDTLGILSQDLRVADQPDGGATDGGIDPTRNYLWEAVNGNGNEPPGGWAELSYGSGELNYEAQPDLDLEEDYWYRRIVFSGPIYQGREQVCADTSEAIHIRIHTAISDNLIDPADSACFNSLKEVKGEAAIGEPGEESSYQWLDALTGSPLPGSEGQNYSYGFNTLGPYRFSRVARVGVCADTSNTMDIAIMELPGGVLSADLSRACEKDTLFNVVLNTDEISSYITPWEIYLDDGVNQEASGPYFVDENGQIEVQLETGEDEPSTEYNYTLAGIRYVSTTGRFGCEAPEANLSGNVDLTVFHRPVPRIMLGGLEKDSTGICGTEVELTVDPDHGSGTWTSDPGVHMEFSPDASSLSVRAWIPESQEAWEIGNYLLSYVSEAGDCAGRDTFRVFYYEQPEPAHAGRDDTIYVKNTIYLTAEPATAGEGTWTVVAGGGTFEDEHDPHTFALDLDKGSENRFRWTVANGVCISSDDFAVITQSDASPYEGFSPNGDGLNDYFIVRGLKEDDAYTKISFRVSFFNALGKTVRELDHESVGELDVDQSLIPGGLNDGELVIWDGLAKNGNPVPSGTYYYVVRGKVEQYDLQMQKISEEPINRKNWVVVQE